MTPATFELHLAQTELVLSKLDGIPFTDAHKQKHLAQIKELFTTIKAADYASFSPSDMNLARRCVDVYLLMGAEYLGHSSDESAVPKELLFCLNAVMEEWLPDKSEYILTTSLGRRFNKYQFESIRPQSQRVLEDFYKRKFNGKFDKNLLLLNMPEDLVNDYLANVTLYHEIGHFIDRRYAIIDRIAGTHPSFLSITGDVAKYDQKVSYFREFFADIFAAQYVNDALNKFLNYIAWGNPNSATHPATDLRILHVQDFLTNTSNSNINIIKEYTKKITGKDLEVRYTNITSSFDHEQVISVSSYSEMHSLFIKGWETWTDSKTTFPRATEEGLLTSYKRLNELIQESIRLFMHQKLGEASNSTSAK